MITRVVRMFAGTTLRLTCFIARCASSSATTLTRPAHSVAPDRLRFDFTSSEALGAERLQRVSDLANAQVLEDKPVDINTMSYDEAIELGAMALFGEKYGDSVRVVNVPSFQPNFAAARMYIDRANWPDRRAQRVIDRLGHPADRSDHRLRRAGLSLPAAHPVATNCARKLRVGVDSVAAGVDTLIAQNRDLERTIEQLQLQLATSDIDRLVNGAVQVNGFSLLATRVNVADRDTLLQVGDRLRDRIGQAL